MKNFAVFTFMFFSVVSHAALPVGNSCQQGWIYEELETRWSEDDVNCVTQSQAIENMMKYVNICGLNEVQLFESDPYRIDKLFSEDQLYGRFFLKPEASLELKNLFNKDFSEGTVVIYRLYPDSEYRDMGLLAVTCEGTVYEYFME